jgi:hypothetical protein
MVSKAMDLKEQMGITDKCAFLRVGLNALNFGMGFKSWMFLEIKSAAQVACSKYCEISEQLVNDSNVTADQIYNADETGLFWRCLPTSALAGEGETSASGFKQKKDRLTVLTCANSTSTHKVKLLLIGNYY